MGEPENLSINWCKISSIDSSGDQNRLPPNLLHVRILHFNMQLVLILSIPIRSHWISEETPTIEAPRKILLSIILLV